MSRDDAAVASSSGWRTFGYVYTAAFGCVFAAVAAAREQWLAAAILLAAALLFAAAERWALRTHPNATSRTAGHWVYVAAVAVITVAYVAATGGEFYHVTLPALAFLPAANTIGNAVAAAREGSD